MKLYTTNSAREKNYHNIFTWLDVKRFHTGSGNIEWSFTSVSVYKSKILQSNFYGRNAVRV